MNDLKNKLKQGLSGLDALEYLRILRGTSKQSLPDTADPQVKLSFGRGHTVVGPSATLDELLAAPSESLPAKEVPFHRGFEYVLKSPFEPSIELTKDGIVESGVYVRREVMEPSPDPATKAEPHEVLTGLPEPFESESHESPELRQEPLPVPVLGVQDEFLGQIAEEFDVESKELTERPFVPKTLQAPQDANIDLPAIDEPNVKRPVGRPPKRVQLTEAERKAAYRLKLKEEEARKQARTETECKAVSVLDDYKPIVKDRGGKTSGVPKNLLIKRVLEQDERCIYCDRRFGSLVLIDGQIKTLKAQPDHFQPVADRRNDSSSNIHAADQVCNERIKGSRKFATLEEARNVIQAAWAERGWTDAPLLMPFEPSTDRMIYGYPN